MKQHEILLIELDNLLNRSRERCAKYRDMEPTIEKFDRELFSDCTRISFIIKELQEIENRYKN